MNETNTAPAMQVTLDINKLIESYNKADFMKEVFTKAIKESHHFLVKALYDFVLADLIKSQVAEDLKENVKKAMQEQVTKLTDDYQFKNEVQKVIYGIVQKNENLLQSKVANAINEVGNKERIVETVTNTLERKIIDALYVAARQDEAGY